MNTNKFIILPFILSFLMSFNSFAEVNTAKDFYQLDEEAQVELLFNYELEEEDWSVEDMPDENIKPVLKEIILDAQAGISEDEVDNDISNIGKIVAIGSLETNRISLYRSLDGEVVAIGVSVYQGGGEYLGEDDLESYYFETEEDALKANIEPSTEVCWSGAVYYLWQNNEWTLLSYEDSEGRGLSWCGW